MRSTNFRFPVSTLAGSTLRNISIFRKSYRIKGRYSLKLRFTSLFTGFFEIFRYAENKIWGKRLRKYKFENPPVFIIGFWRSGTTMLHNIFCQDQRAAYTTTFQTVFPHLVLSQSWWLKPVANFFLPVKRPFDNVSMDMDFPQEEEFGLMNLQPASIYKFFLFPEDFDRIIDEELFTADLPEEHLSEWIENYDLMVRKAIFNTKGSLFIGKNPCNIARTDLLKMIFPGAKFIFIHRNPYEVTESLYRFILSIFPGTQLQDIPSSFGRRNVVRLYKMLMRFYLDERRNFSADELIEIRMEDFVRDPENHMRYIYGKFGIKDFDKAWPLMEKYILDHPKSRNESYAIDPETIDLINETASDIVHELGYELKEHKVTAA